MEAEGPRERAHVRTLRHPSSGAPASSRLGLRTRAAQIDFYVQRPPQGDRTAVLSGAALLIMHDVLSLGFRLLSV